MGAWAQGEAIANLFHDGRAKERAAAAGFFLELAKHYISKDLIESAKRAIQRAAETWPEGRVEMLDDPFIAGLL